MQSHDRRIKQWLEEIENGRLRLPVFQRGMVWKARNAEQLFESILKDSPAGAALILKVNAQDEMFASQPIDQAPDLQDNVIEHLLDGQQRLTSIYQCLHNKFNGRKFFLEIPDINVKMDPKDLSLSVRSIRNGPKARAKQWLDDPKLEFEKNLIPLNLFRDGFPIRQEFESWISKSIGPHDTQNHSKIMWLSSLREFVGNIIADFNIPTLILNADTDVDTALTVFIRMNTTGVNLKEYDIVLAQLFHRTGEDLDLKIEELNEKYPEAYDYIDFKTVVLPSIALLGKSTETDTGKGKITPYEPAKSTYLKEDFAELFETNWFLLEAGIPPTVSLLREMNIFYKDSIPTSIVIPVSVAIFGRFGSEGDQASRVRNVLKAYLWRSFLSPRYDRSTQSKILQDYRRICSHLGTPSTRITDIFEGPDWGLPIEDDLLNIKWPRSTNRLAKGILAIINTAGAKDFASGRPLGHGSIFEREYHHIFPKRYCLKNNFGDPDLVLNCALIEKKTNRIIGADPPAQYYENREKYFDDASEINERFESHLIPVPELLSNHYEEFKQKRAKLIREKIIELCHGDLDNISDENGFLGTEIDLIYSGENELVEFKSSIRWDYKNNKVNRELVKNIFKTVAGFANSRGGTLFIGVDDHQKIIGIEDDLNAMNANNTDQYELKLNNLLVAEFGADIISEIIPSIKFLKCNEREICVMRVTRSKMGVYCNHLDKDGVKTEKFFIRQTNRTIPLSPSEEHKYRRRMGLR